MFATPSRLVVFGVAALCVASLVPALAGGAQRGPRMSSYNNATPTPTPDPNVTCTSSQACVADYNNGSGAAITGDSAGGVGVAGNSSGIAGVYGTAYTPGTSGVEGVATTGAGVYGSASGGPGVVGSSSAGPAGIIGSTGHPNSNGVQGYITATTGYGAGVSGSAPNSSGVFGSSKTGTGVYGSGTTGIGVYGTSDGTLGGIFGNATNAKGIGVSGGNANAVGGIGVSGVAVGSGASAKGVLGLLTNTNPSGYGVLGVIGTASNNKATAVVGNNGAPNGGYGLLGAGTGEGVLAFGGAPKGNVLHPALAVFNAYDADSVGVFTNITSTSTLETFQVKAVTTDAVLCSAAKQTAPCTAGGDVYITGDVHVKGRLYTTKGGATPYDDVTAQSERVEDDGEARLQAGQAFVPLDPRFAATLDPHAPYLVFVTPEGDRSMFVSERSARGFVVREIGGGRSNVPFAYRIVANAKAVAGDGGTSEIRRAIPDAKRSLGAIEETERSDAAYGARLAAEAALHR